LKDQVICERAFLSGCDLIMAERERIFLHALRDFKEGLLSGVFDTPDRMQHTFWRLPGYLDKGHPLYNQAEAQAFSQIIPDNYRYMESILGKTLERGDKDTLIIVCSDHGLLVFAGLSISTLGWKRST
jgi:predicted AlkP superfamily phosphohydrolase/phosphomutase